MTNETKTLKWQTQHEVGYQRESEKLSPLGVPYTETVVTGYERETHTAPYEEDFHKLLLESEGDDVFNVEVIE